MATIKQEKIVSSLPGSLTANTIYYVKVGAGFDIYVTNNIGTVIATPLNKGYSYFYIWAEENADLGNNAFEWAFGNGANTPANQGVIIGIDCELVFLGLSIRGSTSCEVDVLKNGVLQGVAVSTVSALRGQADVSLAYVKGDYFNFKTLVGNAASNGGIVTAMFRVPI